MQKSIKNNKIDYSNIIISDAGKKDNLRTKIKEQVGDTASLLGTTADATQLLLFAFSKLIVGINSAKNMKEMQEATTEFLPIATSFLSKIETGDLKLPFLDKGLLNVIADIEDRAGKVAKVLEEAKEEAKIKNKLN